MNTKVARVCLMVLGLALVANSRPSPRASGGVATGGNAQNANTLKTGAEHHQLVEGAPRRKRNATPNGDEAAIERFRQIANATGKAYMLDLYKQLTLSNASVTTPVTQANTIKSLNYEKLDQNDCRFRFSLAGVNTREFVLHTKLRLYREAYVNTEPTYIVQISDENSVEGKNHVQKAVVSEKKGTGQDNGGYVEFDVADIFRPAIGKASSITFKVEVTQNPTGSLNCGNGINFLSGSDNENKIPMLVVYSFERSDMVNITEAEQQILLQLNRTDVKKVTESSQRRKRSASSIKCGRHPLTISSNMVSPNLIGDYNNFRIMVPSSFDAGICGGQCLSDNAHHLAERHPLLINILQRQNVLTKNMLGNNNFNFTQCCAPVKYDHLHVLGVADNNVPIIHTIEHMRVTECGCTDIIS